MRIDSPVTSLTGTQDLVVTASVSGFAEGDTIGIKGAFYKDGTTNYFGLTQNGDSWTKNNAPNLNQRVVVAGVWDGTLTVRSDYADSGFTGDGEYRFKVRYYYGASGSDWSENFLTIFIHADPTPSPTPTAPPAATRTPTATGAPVLTVTPSIPAVSDTVSSPGAIGPSVRENEAGTSGILGITETADIGDRVREAGDEVPVDEPVEPPAHTLVYGLLFVGVGIGFLATGLALQKAHIWKKTMLHGG